MPAKILRVAAPSLLALHLFCCAAAGAVKLPAPSGGKAALQGRDPVQEKIDRIVKNGAKTPVPPLTTRFSEDEVNQILRGEVRELPSGFSDPQVMLLGNNTLVMRAIVDFDEYKRRRQGRGGLGPLALLTGRLPVTARGVLHTRNGQAQLKLERADMNGIPVPPAVVREIISALTRSQDKPQGYDIEEPFTLPANIRTVVIYPKEALVTQ